MERISLEEYIKFNSELRDIIRRRVNAVMFDKVDEQESRKSNDNNGITQSNEKNESEEERDRRLNKEMKEKYGVDFGKKPRKWKSIEDSLPENDK